MSRPAELELVLAVYLAAGETHLGVDAVCQRFGLTHQRALHEVNEALRRATCDIDFSEGTVPLFNRALVL